MDIDEIVSYSMCTLFYFFKYIARVPRKKTGKELLEEVVKEAIFSFYEGEGEDPGQLIEGIWQDLLGEWGKGKELLEVLIRYAGLRLEILLPFRKGKITRRDGTLYVKPEWTTEFKRMAREKGLARLEREIRREARDLPILFEREAELGVIFSRSLEMCSVFSGPRRENFIAKLVPFKVSLQRGEVEGKIDLLFRSDEGPFAILLDFSEKGRKRDPRVIAALLGKLSQGEEISRVGSFRLIDGTIQWVEKDPLLRSSFSSLLQALYTGISERVFFPPYFEFACGECPYSQVCEGTPYIFPREPEEERKPVWALVSPEERERFLRAANEAGLRIERIFSEEEIDELLFLSRGKRGMIVLPLFSSLLPEEKFSLAVLSGRGWKIFPLFDLLDERWIEDIGKAIKFGEEGKEKRALLLRGYVPSGRPPPGYKAVRTSRGTRWIKDAEKAALVKRAFLLRAGGATYKELSQEVGLYRSSSSWSRFFRREVYHTGVMKWGGRTVKLDPIVDSDLFFRCQPGRRQSKGERR